VSHYGHNSIKRGSPVHQNFHPEKFARSPFLVGNKKAAWRGSFFTSFMLLMLELFYYGKKNRI
jgi:hypothetical protein